MEFNILWIGNPLSVVGSFGTRQCKLCLEEKQQIISSTIGVKDNLVMNSCDEIYRCCRHNSKFYRLTNIHPCEFMMEDSDSDTDSDDSDIDTGGGDPDTDEY